MWIVVNYLSTEKTAKSLVIHRVIHNIYNNIIHIYTVCEKCNRKIWHHMSNFQELFGT